MIPFILEPKNIAFVKGSRKFEAVRNRMLVLALGLFAAAALGSQWINFFYERNGLTVILGFVVFAPVIGMAALVNAWMYHRLARGVFIDGEIMQFRTRQYPGRGRFNRYYAADVEYRFTTPEGSEKIARYGGVGWDGGREIPPPATRCIVRYLNQRFYRLM